MGGGRERRGSEMKIKVFFVDQISKESLHSRGSFATKRFPFCTICLFILTWLRHTHFANQVLCLYLSHICIPGKRKTGFVCVFAPTLLQQGTCCDGCDLFTGSRCNHGSVEPPKNTTLWKDFAHNGNDTQHFGPNQSLEYSKSQKMHRM